MVEISNNRLEMLGSAAAGIAHDINNQLTLILNYIETMDLGGARAAASRCAALTTSMLACSRSESLDLRPVDVVKFLSDFTGQLCLPPGVRLIVDLPESLPEIRPIPWRSGAR
jgi:signal transduction histidine kinase